MKRFGIVHSKLLRGGEPKPEEIRVLNELWDVKKIISLDESAGNRIRPICEDLDINQIIIPICDNKTKKSIDYLLNNFDDIFSNNNTIYVHCVHGRDRTGLVIALYRMIKENWPLKKALEEAFSYDFCDGLSEDWTSLFFDVLKSIKRDKNDTNDIVSSSREISNSTEITGPTNGASYFTPMPPINQDFIFGFPRPKTERETPFNQDYNVSNDKNRKKRKEKLKLLSKQDSNDSMAQIGLIDNINPLLRGISSEGLGPLGILPYGNYYL